MDKVGWRIFLTGPPGVGKTTVIRKLYEYYSRHGVMVSGIITEENRSGNVRTGFKIRNLMSGEEGRLAMKGTQPGPKVGSYTVNTVELERIGAGSLQNAVRGDASLVLVDEIGPMEMTSPVFRRVLAEVLASQKTTVASVKYGSHYDEVEHVSQREETRIVEVSRENRASLLPELTKLIDAAITR